MLKVRDAFKRGGVVAGLLAAGLATTACLDDSASDAAPAAASDAIAEVTTASGVVVSFFEPSPGALGIGQQVPLGVAPVATGGMSAVELYQSLAPGKLVPQALVDAQARAGRSSAKPGAQPAAVAAPTGPAAFTSNWFENNHCYEDDGVFWHFINCHTDPLPTQSMSGTHTDIDEFRVDACANTASVTLRIWVEDEQKVGIQLKPGNCYAYHWWTTDNADFFKVTTTVTDPGNYGLAVKWNH